MDTLGRTRPGMRGVVLILAATLVFVLLVIALVTFAGFSSSPTVLAMAPSDALPTATTTAATTTPLAAQTHAVVSTAVTSDLPPATTDSAPECVPPAPRRPVVTDVEGVHDWSSPTLVECGLWLSVGADGSGIGLELERVDVGTGGPEAGWMAGDVIAGLAMRGGELWGIETRSSGESSLIRIDQARRETVDQIPLGFTAEHVVFVGDEAWILSSDLNALQTHRVEVIRILDMRSRLVTDTFAVAGAPDSSSFFGVGFGSVWVKVEGVITRIDVATHALSTLQIDAVDQCLLTDDWLYCGTGWAQVVQLSPTSGQVVGFLQLSTWSGDGGVLAMASDGPSLWVQPRDYYPSSSNGRTEATELFHIDAATDKILETYDLAIEQPLDMFVGAGSVWIVGADRPLIRWQLPAMPKD